jgi:hypothetical protein
MTLPGVKITNTRAQLFAKCDVKGPIKGRRQRAKNNRTLRVLGLVQKATPSAWPLIAQSHSKWSPWQHPLALTTKAILRTLHLKLVRKHKAKIDRGKWANWRT